MRPLVNVAWDQPTVVPIRIQAHPSHRILVAEDDTGIRELNAEVLARAGFAVKAVKDGLAAWEALHATNYHLLITDHDMPRLSGLGLVKRLRSARMALPVILASGTWPMPGPQWAQELQLAAILPKPFSPDQLLGTVKEVLRV